MCPRKRSRKVQFIRHHLLGIVEQVRQSQSRARKSGSHSQSNEYLDQTSLPSSKYTTSITSITSNISNIQPHSTAINRTSNTLTHIQQVRPKPHKHIQYSHLIFKPLALASCSTPYLLSHTHTHSLTHSRARIFLRILTFIMAPRSLIQPHTDEASDQ